MPPDLSTAALAFDEWHLTLAGELGRSPTPEEQAGRFDLLAGELADAVERHALPDFWDMLPADPSGATLRILLEPPRTDFRTHFLTLLNADPLAFGPPLYYQPSQLHWLVDDYFTLRRLPAVLSLDSLQDWLRERKLSDGGRARLATMRPEVRTLRDVLSLMGEKNPVFAFSPRGIDALVDECLVRVGKRSRSEYLALPVAAVLEWMKTWPPPHEAVVPATEEGAAGPSAGDKTTRADAVVKISTHYASLTEKQKGAMIVRKYAEVAGCSTGLASGILSDLSIATKGKAGKQAGKPRTIPGGGELVAVLTSPSTDEVSDAQAELLRQAIEKHGVENLVKVAELYATQEGGDDV